MKSRLSLVTLFFGAAAFAPAGHADTLVLNVWSNSNVTFSFDGGAPEEATFGGNRFLSYWYLQIPDNGGPGGIGGAMWRDPADIHDSDIVSGLGYGNVVLILDYHEFSYRGIANGSARDIGVRGYPVVTTVTDYRHVAYSPNPFDPNSPADFVPEGGATLRMVGGVIAGLAMLRRWCSVRWQSS